MSSPVDPKVKQALRKKPAERTPEVRGLQRLPRWLFSFILFLNLRFALALVGVPAGFLLGAWFLSVCCTRRGQHSRTCVRSLVIYLFLFAKLDLSSPTRI